MVTWLDGRIWTGINVLTSNLIWLGGRIWIETLCRPEILLFILLHLHLHIHIIFCRHILFCNVLTTILRPNFEEPLDTVKQLVERNIEIYTTPGSYFWKYFFQDSTIPEYKILGETLIIADDWDQYINISKHVIGAGTHALMTLSLPPMYLDMGRWHRSKEKVSGINPFAGYLTNKKWHLNEVIYFKLFVHALLLIQS